MRVSLGLVVLLLAAGFPLAARGDAPAYLPVQGVLTDAAGVPLEGDTSLRFALYTADVGGTSLWNETQWVLVEHGLFTTYLGDATPLSLALFRDHEQVYLGVSVGGDAEMPRFQLATTGFAAFAQFAGDAGTLGGRAPDEFQTAGADVAWSDLTGIPTGFADGIDDGGSSYSAGVGLTLTGSTFAANQTTIEGWARGVCLDTEAELTTLLNDNYAATAHAHPWSSLTGMPAGFADGIDDGSSYSAGAGLTLAGSTFSLNTAFTDARYALAGHTHDFDSVYVNEGQTDSITSGMIVDGQVGSTEIFGTSMPSRLHHSNLGECGQASGWDPNTNAWTTNATWLETCDGESGGLYIDQDLVSIWASTDTSRVVGGRTVYPILELYDEDALPSTTPELTLGGLSATIAASSGAYLSTGGVWTNASDRDLKREVQPVDPQQILDQLAKLAVTTWQYVAEQDGIRHIGPMAQDFFAVFGVGADDRGIGTVDADGVALAAIQALYQRNLELERRVEQLEQRLEQR